MLAMRTGPMSVSICALPGRHFASITWGMRAHIAVGRVLPVCLSRVVCTYSFQYATPTAGRGQSLRHTRTLQTFSVPSGLSTNSGSSCPW